MKKFFGYVFVFAGIILAFYVGGWVMFIQPIMDACRHFDAGTLTGAIVGATVLKCVFASTVGTIIAYAGILSGGRLFRK